MHLRIPALGQAADPAPAGPAALQRADADLRLRRLRRADRRLTAGLHRLVDLGHHLAFNIAGDFTLSTGLGLDPLRVLIVPALGGLVLGLGAYVMRRFRSATWSIRSRPMPCTAAACR
jgi:hypothetical protein